MYSHNQKAELRIAMRATRSPRAKGFCRSTAAAAALQRQSAAVVLAADVELLGIAVISGFKGVGALYCSGSLRQYGGTSTHANIAQRQSLSAALTNGNTAAIYLYSGSSTALQRQFFFGLRHSVLDMRHYVAALSLLILDFILILGIAAMKTTSRDCLLLDEYDLDIPPLMLRIFYRSRKVCEEINAIQLSATQIGNVRLPFYLKPDDPDHKNLELEAIFSAAIPHVADILATFDHNHPVIESFMQFFANKKTIDIHREGGDWMRSLCLVPTPELEAVLMEPLGNLLKHELLADMLRPERHRRVMAVGSALFQLLAVQHILGEELSLDGSILTDLALGDVVPRSSDGPEALAAMFAAIPLSAAHMEKKLVPQAAGNKPAKRMKKKDLSSSIPQRKNPRRKPAGSITKPVQVTKSKKKSRYPGYIDIDSDGNEL
ncbi:hypothetical protein B0H14DRAFT_3600025 [Mycena olivaceomarginata]|nr:hypothetical protein B0H14DRAFT_3600025 [Mycena olivaceomarginata]